MRDECKLADNVKERILGFEKEFSTYIIDPLHGQIGLTQLEADVIATKAFRRLRNIQQLGFASNIYPGATHKRYEHCIGTLYVTWTMMKKFLVNYYDQECWAKQELLEYFSNDILKCLRIAALLHDLGHGPFSHTFEQVAASQGIHIDHDQLTSYLLTCDFPKKTITSIIADKKQLQELQGTNEIETFRQELKVIPTEFRDLIVGIYEKEHETAFPEPKGFKCIRFFLNNIIKGDIGSDRIDYLLRDTYFSGLGHRFNFSDLLNNLRGMYDRDSDRLLSAVDYDGKNIVEFMMITRYYHYRLIAHHTRNILEEIKFKDRVNKYLQNSSFSFFKSAADNDSIERILPAFDKELELAGTLNMGSIWYEYLRFFFYRIATDSKLRNDYCNRMRESIVKGIKSFQGEDIKEDDIYIAFTMETAHIPIMQIYRQEYRIEKREDIEKYSVLLHDYSVLIQSLARTYLEDSSLLVFARKSCCKAISEYLRKSIHSCVSSDLFREIMSKTNTLKTNRYDFLLYALHSITDNGRTTQSGLSSFFDKIKGMQTTNGVKFYDFDSKLFYDPSRGSFCYPFVIDKEGKIKEISLIDDLFALDAIGLIDVRNHLVTTKLEKAPSYHSSTYYIKPTKIDNAGDPLIIPLKSALKLYSAEFRDKYGLTKEVLRASR
jgi:HD superfamily phosphohydrolase